MTATRRQFVYLGALAAAGATSACGGATPAPQQSQEAASGSVRLLMQFSGLVMHGAWPANHTARPGAWDALLVSGSHEPRLRLPLANVVNPRGYAADRYRPDCGVWDLKGSDVIVRVDEAEGRAVTVATGLRQAPSACPDPTDSSAEDIAWVADLSAVLPGGAVIRPEFGAESRALAAGGGLDARVRLSSGRVFAAAASNPAFDRLTVGFSNASYPAQFMADLVRYETPLSRTISLDLVPFGQESGTRIELTGDPVVAYVEHHDPHLALHGPPDDFAARHFTPYQRVLVEAPQPITPVFGCCDLPSGAACEPPYYCFQARGRFQ